MSSPATFQMVSPSLALSRLRRLTTCFVTTDGLSAFEGALNSNPDPFPHGLFWVVRSGEKPRDAVISLLRHAREHGCQAGYIEIGGFDELMADLFRPHEDTLPQIENIVRAQRDKRQPVYPSYSGRHWPVIRTNALEITNYPSPCTIFEAAIDGTAEVQAVIEKYKTRVTAARIKKGVIASELKSLEP
jgi:hypothetical protein